MNVASFSWIRFVSALLRSVDEVGRFVGRFGSFDFSELAGLLDG